MKKNKNRKLETEKDYEASSNPNLRYALMFGAGIILAVVVFATITGFADKKLENSAASSTTGTNQGTGNLQVATVSVRGSSYVFSNSNFAIGSPVRLEFDMATVRGCARSVVIPEFGINKYISEKDNIIEFTPLRAGTFRIACSMDMYRGSFTVVNSDGSKSTFIEPEPAVQTGGGCGCGGGSGSSCTMMKTA